MNDKKRYAVTFHNYWGHCDETVFVKAYSEEGAEEVFKKHFPKHYEKTGIDYITEIEEDDFYE